MGDAQRLLLSLICHSGLDPESSVSKSQRSEDRPPGAARIEPGGSIGFVQLRYALPVLRSPVRWDEGWMLFAPCELLIEAGRGRQTEIELGAPADIVASRFCLRVFGREIRMKLRSSHKN